MTAIYSLLSAAKTQERNLEVSSNNLSNANTPGFKADKAVFGAYLKQAMGMERSSLEQDFAKSDFLSPYGGGTVNYAITNGVVANTEEGSYQQTGNSLDFALQGEGFFTIDSPMGRRYTRDGEFQRSTEGFLVDTQGNFVLGSNGPIKIDGSKINVTEEGLVEVDGNFVDQLQLARFDKPETLSKLGKTYVVPADPSQITIDATNKVSVKQGMMEGSNVSTVREMTNLIDTNRSFDAAQRAIRVLDELDDRSISLART